MENSIKLSVLVRCYNEEQNLIDFFNRYIITIKKILINFKIYFIDDGSKDNTWNIIKTIYLDRYLKDIFVKLKFILFGIHRDGTLPDKNGNFENSIRFSLILSKSLFNLGILCSHVILFKNFKKIFLQKKEIFFLLLIILNLLTHIYLYELLPNI